ncbi:EamA family transporter [Xanthomonas sp. GPE 39]|uniref:DMT family transporter n=1 Tax=Xanthomonas sp. GPE 39 TaxID=1583099 RepID=UPI0005F2B1E6|nr:EamA family transporter [Xanthomonas sp. GPE 39]
MSRTALHRYAVGFALLMSFDTIAQISFKLAGSDAFPPQAELAWLLRLLTSPWLYCALLSNIGSFCIWMKLLEDAPIGPAFAASHMEAVSVMLISAFWFNERISALQALGAVLIVTGIVCLALGERETRADAH